MALMSRFDPFLPRSLKYRYIKILKSRARGLAAEVFCFRFSSFCKYKEANRVRRGYEVGREKDYLAVEKAYGKYLELGKPK